MSLQYFIKDNKEIWILLIHFLLGAVSLISIYFYIGWVYFILLTNIPGIINKVTRSKTILLLSGYLFGIELIGRMVKASPFVPYQVGSYIMLILFSYGILRLPKTNANTVGKIILLLCIPGFYMIPYDHYSTYFTNSFSGIITLGLAALYFGNQTYTAGDLKDFIKVTVLPIITILVYISFKTPDYTDIEYSLGANFETSGGFGSNQVSTVLGVGACLLLVSYLKKDMVFKSWGILSLVFIGAFLFRGLLTFSRGGIIGSLFAVLLSYLYLSWRINRNIGAGMLRIIAVTAGLYFIFTFSNQITGGVLSQRYQGETAGTISGTKEKDLNVYTSNRSSLAAIEWSIFNQNMFLGVGPGGGYEAREKYFGTRIASHTEVTRLLAEQGLPGLLIAVIFVFYPLVRIKKSTSREETYYLIAFFSLAIITSFHSGMRTMLTPLFWGIGCARFSFPLKSNI